MPNKRIAMRNIREVLRLRLVAGLSNRSTKTSIGAVQKLLCKAKDLQVTCLFVEPLSDTELALMFYPKANIDLQTICNARLESGSYRIKTQGNDKAIVVGGIHGAIP